MNNIIKLLNGNKRDISILLLTILAILRMAGVEIPYGLENILFGAGTVLGGIGAIHGKTKDVMKNDLIKRYDMLTADYNSLRNKKG